MQISFFGFFSVYFNLKKLSYFNKSKTNDGNKPKAMFKAIEITATA